VATSLGGIAGAMLGVTGMALAEECAFVSGTYTSVEMGNQMAAYNPATWVTWNTGYTTAGNQTVWVNWNSVVVTTVPVIAAQQPNQQQIDAWHALAQKNIEDRAAAARRAEEFLLENLSPAQRETYHKQQMFIVETPRKNRYAIHKVQQVRKMEGDRAVESYCIHTLGVPREDELLGFKLLLEANEDEFLRTANATRLAA
jgi:hypothetical protein